MARKKCKTPSNNLGKLMSSCEAVQRKKESSSNIVRSSTEAVIKQKLLDQPINDFEAVLKTACSFTTGSTEPTDDETSRIIMNLLEKDTKPKKPVSSTEEMEFIDEGPDVVEAPPPAVPKSSEGQVKNTPRLGNPEHYVEDQTDSTVIRMKNELTADDMMKRNIENEPTWKQRMLTRSGAEIRCDEMEQSLGINKCKTMPKTESILGPVSGGLFNTFNNDPISHNLVQRNGIRPMYMESVQQAIENRLPYQELATPDKKEMSKHEMMKMRKERKKKTTEKWTEYTVPIEGNQEKTLFAILEELGEQVDIDDKPEKPTKKEKKKQGSKEQVKANEGGGGGSGTGGGQSKTTTTPSNNKNKKNNKMDKQQDKKKESTPSTIAEAQEEDKPAQVVNDKRSSSGAGQQSEEDDDQSYVSAQENLGSNSRLSTPPVQADFADAQGHRDEGLADALLDPNNYRADDDVDELAQQLLKEDDEFITVGKNNKKKKNQKVEPERPSYSSVVVDHRNSPSMSGNRRNNAPSSIGDDASNSGRRFSTPSDNNKSMNNGNNASNNRGGGAGRPVVTTTATLGDYMDVGKKDTHKNAKHKKTSTPNSKPQNKQQISIEDPSLTFVDAVESPISVNTNSGPPVFSYADAAKKSSGENSPHEMSPSPAQHKNVSAPSPSHVPSTPRTGKAESPTTGVQLPPHVAESSSHDDFSFVFEGNLDDKKKNKQAEKPKKSVEEPSAGQRSLNIGGKEIKFGGFQKAETEKTVLDPRAVQIVSDMKVSWTTFMSGTPPKVYKPKSKKNNNGK